MKIRYSFIVIGLLLASAVSALGAVSAEEAKMLGTTLTAVGAEKEGNADGSIPPYTGGLTTPPANFKEGSGIRPDPFADEKPLFSINAGNMSKYDDKLTEAAKVLMKKYQTFRIDVYPTHRTVALPKYVLDATAINAVTAQTTNGGLGIENARSGVPFPIPKDGYEAMWNHLLRFTGEAIEYKFRCWNINSAGRKSLSSSGTAQQEFPYYNKLNPSADTYIMLKINYNAPARRNGEALMAVDPLNLAEKSRVAHQYLPGQRRVKLAPEIAFDTPNPGAAGMATYDDAFIFNGSMERYNFKLVGKKEMYVPYNEYKMQYHTKSDDLFLPHHINPDHVRFELHRVWVVEATLKPGKRHIYTKRIFYLDEDSWVALASDQYDARGQLFRAAFSTFTYSYDAQAPFVDAIFYYDLIANSYNLQMHFGDGGYLRHTSPFPKNEWSPDSLAGSGIR
jgi:hypothetical protein